MQATLFDTNSLLILLRLCHSLSLQPVYNIFKKNLDQILKIFNADSKINHETTKQDIDAFRHLLGVIQTELLLEAEEEDLDEDEDGDTTDEDMGDDTGAPATDQDENAIDWQASLEPWTRTRRSRSWCEMRYKNLASPPRDTTPYSFPSKPSRSTAIP